MSTRLKTRKKASASSSKRSEPVAANGPELAAVAWKPHAYQKRAIKFLLEHAVGGLFLDPGLGKTSITLAALKILRKEKVHRKALVIAPLRVCGSVWPAEVEKWKDFEDTKIAVLHGSRKEKTLQETDADILCINPEGLEWLFGVTKTKTRNGKTRVDVDKARVKFVMNKLGVDTLVIDESTKFKRGSSQRFKILKLVLHYFHRRWILTGTPAPNGMMDLFSQTYIMDLGRALGQYITHYRKMYFTPTGFGGFTYRLQPGAEKLIQDKLKKLVLRLAAKDYLEVPEVIWNPVRFNLPDSAREIYDEMEEEMVAEMNVGTVTAPNAATAMGKCAQIANGGLYKQADSVVSAKRVKGKNGWSLMHHGKDEMIAELVEELNGQPVIVAYEFDHDLDRLREVFGKNMEVIGGGVSLKESKRIEKDWNAGKIQVLALHPASAAHGLNLQHASDHEVGHVIFYGITWDYELFDQLIKRMARQGSKHKRVLAHLLIARNTVDEAKLGALRGKAKGQNSLLDALHVYVRSRGKKASQHDHLVTAKPRRPAPAGPVLAPQAAPARPTAAARAATLAAAARAGRRSRPAEPAKGKTRSRRR